MNKKPINKNRMSKTKTKCCAYITAAYPWLSTVPLNYNFILHTWARMHAWCHAVFCVLIAKMRRDVVLPRVVFTRDVEFTCNGNVTFS